MWERQMNYTIFLILGRVGGTVYIKTHTHTHIPTLLNRVFYPPPGFLIRKPITLLYVPSRCHML